MNKSFLRKVCLFLIVASSYKVAMAQYANDWIDFGKIYYKVSVASTGAYRISFVDLQSAGFPVGSVDPRRVQLYHRGVEQAIIVQGQADAQFDPGDYIEFYGKKNDGTNDTRLYNASNLQPHSYYNLYSDTSAYFLTWNQGLVQGKRMSFFSEVNVGGTIPLETYHNNERLQVYSNEYSTGNTVSGVLQYTQFDEGEGWTGTTICVGNAGCTGQLDLIINNLSDGVVAGGNPQLEMMLVGRDELNHLAEIYVGASVGSLRLLSTENFINYQTRQITLPLNWSDISAGGQLIVRVKALGVGGIRDRLSVSYIKVNHPQNFNMALQPSKGLKLEERALDKSYIEITNPASNLSIWDITDSNNIQIIGTTAAGPNVSAVVPNTSTSRDLFIKNSFSLPQIKKIAFRQIAPAAHNFIIISNKALMKPASGYEDPVKAYGGFRTSVEGGGYDTLVVTVDQLYNQFNYGENSSSAIYEFMKFMVEQGNPEYLFLIGKGLNVSQGYFRKTVFAPNDYKDLVPSAGMPGSDMAFTAGLNGTTFEPAVPTGRITASTAAEVAAYLNKIKEMEGLPFQELWRKEVLHLSGGILPLELPVFRQFLDNFGEVANGPYYGGSVATIAKQEPNPVELINISEEVNAGVNLITFFGHSSPINIDIDIGFVSDPVMGYNNPAKYPAFVINGCNAGVFFSNGKVFGEDWILAADKGARSFIAHSSYGFVSTLRSYTQLFYEVGFGDSTFIRTGIGDIQKEVARRYLLTNSPSISSITQIQQMMMLGDPAVKLFGALKPDYETNDNAIYLETFDGSPVTALSDSFALKVIVKNFGSVSKANLKVRAERTFNDNTTLTYDSIFPSPKLQDTLAIIIRKEVGTSGFGNNQFYVTLDFQDDIEELAEDNNDGLLELFIPLSGTKNLIPRPFEIVNKTDLKLKWQNTDLLSAQRSYSIELDTIDTFDSPFLKQATVSGKVLMEHLVSLTNKDSLAYYWRTRLTDPLPDENAEWATSSFTYIQDGDAGWAQVHFPQYQLNEVAGLTKDPALRELQFEETFASIFVNNFGANHPSPSTTSFKINNVEYNLATQGQPCRNNTINLVAFDKTTLVPYAGIPFIFQDPRTCGREPQIINSFAAAEVETGANDDLLKYIDNIHASDSVVIFSMGNVNYTSWSANVITKLQELGLSSGQLSSLQSGEPIVVFGKKGAAAGTATIIKTSASPPNEQELIVNETLTGKYTQGKMVSTLVGPAESWETFTSYVRDKEADDEYSFDLIGIDLYGKETPLFTGITGSLNISSVNAVDFPLMKLVVHTGDEVNQTPIQLHQWIVNYEPVAEGILTFHGAKEIIERQEGDSWTADYSFINISDKNFSDSLVVEFETFNKTLRISEIKTLKIEAPLPLDSTHFSFTVQTQHKTGYNDVNVFVNDRVLPEQYYENNVLELPNYLLVNQDEFIPVLDVTIDGRYLKNGDYVGTHPLIVANIWDENSFVLKQDTTGIRIFLKVPCENEECEFQPVYFTQGDIEWSPSTATAAFNIEYTPDLLKTGLYELRIEVEDGSGNKTIFPYEVQFNVSVDRLVAFREPYPNPSTHKVFFDFVISGDVVPNSYQLQIFGLDGRVIKDYSGNGSTIHSGYNQLLWNWLDDSGAQVNAGLYFYKFTLTINGKVHTRSGKIIINR